MPSATLLYYREDNGTVPLVDWLGQLPKAARTKCLAQLELLERRGHELRRPLADYLRDGIHELRPSLGGIHYRILYFFHGREAVVVSHGLIKERRVPPVEIGRAIRRMEQFRRDPGRHTFCPGKGN